MEELKIIKLGSEILYGFIRLLYNELMQLHSFLFGIDRPTIDQKLVPMHMPGHRMLLPTNKHNNYRLTEGYRLHWIVVRKQGKITIRYHTD